MALLGTIKGLFSSRPPPPPTGATSRAEIPAAWAQMKSFLADCETGSLDLATLHASDCVGFFERRALVEGAVHAGISLDRAARDYGFTDARHWQTVVRYFEARYSELGAGADGVVRIGFVEEFRRAEALVQERLRDAAARMLEPIHGVSLERFAELSAAIVRLGAAPSRAELSRVLGELGIGAATYGGARRAWLQRIARDSTRTLQRRYLDAFLAARCRFATLLPTGDTEPKSASARRSWSDDSVAVA